MSIYFFMRTVFRAIDPAIRSPHKNMCGVFLCAALHCSWRERERERVVLSSCGVVLSSWIERERERVVLSVCVCMYVRVCVCVSFILFLIALPFFCVCVFSRCSTRDSRTVSVLLRFSSV